MGAPFSLRTDDWLLVFSCCGTEVAGRASLACLQATQTVIAISAVSAGSVVDWTLLACLTFCTLHSSSLRVISNATSGLEIIIDGWTCIASRTLHTGGPASLTVEASRTLGLCRRDGGGTFIPWWAVGAGSLGSLCVLTSLTGNNGGMVHIRTSCASRTLGTGGLVAHGVEARQTWGLV